MAKFVLMIALVLSSFALGEEAPQFVKQGVYVALNTWYPQIIMRDSSGKIVTHYLSRKDNTTGARCIVPDVGTYEPYTAGEEVQNLFVRKVGPKFFGIAPSGDISYTFFSGDKVLEGDWGKSTVKFVRVGDEKAAHQMLTDIPLCDKVVSSETPAALPRSKPIPLTDPLVLDLGNTGIKLGAPRRAVEFDIDVDGFTEKLTWPDDKGAHFLVLDRNGNGNIDDGGELFGTSTLDAWGRKHTTGFGALRSFDSNDDGWIDARDGVYDSLQLWNDANRNGKSDEGELYTLCELHVAAISGGCVDLGESDMYGNCKSHESMVRMVDKSLRKIYELVLITPH